MGITERREREKAQRRVDIIEAAERVFLAEGVEAATMDDVADAAELSKGTLYLYFKSKEDLYLAILVRGMEMLRGKFKAAVASHDLGIDKIAAVGRAYFEFFQDHPDYFEAMLFFESSEPPADDDAGYAADCAEIGDDLFAITADAVSAGIADGTIRGDVDPARTAITLYATATGMLQTTVLKSEKFQSELGVDVDAVIETYFDLIDRSLRTK